MWDNKGKIKTFKLLKFYCFFAADKIQQNEQILDETHSEDGTGKVLKEEEEEVGMSRGIFLFYKINVSESRWTT